MSLTGAPDGEPMRYPVPISDMTVGLYALIGILAACASGSAPATGKPSTRRSWSHRWAG